MRSPRLPIPQLAVSSSAFVNSVAPLEVTTQTSGASRCSPHVCKLSSVEEDPCPSTCRNCSLLRRDLDESVETSRKDRDRVRQLERLLADAIASEDAHEEHRRLQMQRICEVEKQVDDAKSNCARQLQASRSRIAELEGLLTSADSARDDALEQVKTLRTQLTEVKQTVHDTCAERRQDTGDLERLQERFEEMEVKCRQADAQLERAVQDRRRQQDRSQELREQLEQVPLLQARILDLERSSREARTQFDKEIKNLQDRDTQRSRQFEKQLEEAGETHEKESRTRGRLQGRTNDLERQLQDVRLQLQDTNLALERNAEERSRIAVQSQMLEQQMKDMAAKHKVHIMELERQFEETHTGHLRSAAEHKEKLEELYTELASTRLYTNGAPPSALGGKAVPGGKRAGTDFSRSQHAWTASRGQSPERERVQVGLRTGMHLHPHRVDEPTTAVILSCGADAPSAASTTAGRSPAAGSDDRDDFCIASEGSRSPDASAQLPPEFTEHLRTIETYGWKDAPIVWKDGFSLLHWAARENRPALCERLIRFKADPRTADDLGRTALHCARNRSSYDALAVLESAVARPWKLSDVVPSL